MDRATLVVERPESLLRQGEQPGISLACHTGWAKRFLAAGATVFVAPSWSVGDLAAATFASCCYRQLEAGVGTGEAGRLARRATHLAATANRLAFAPLRPGGRR